MHTVLSHVVQKRLSQEHVNVATEALAFVVDSSDRAHTGLMRLLRGVAPDLPNLRFSTQQQTEDSAHPDMWGLDGDTPRAFIENKFRAGVTPNRPVKYLQTLAAFKTPAVLLVVVPETRLETGWRELLRQLDAAKVAHSDRAQSAGVHRVVAIDFGSTALTKPRLGIASWGSVLSAIETELPEEPQRRNDLLQLRDLCDAADEETAAPFSSAELTNQRTPSFLLHLNSIVQRAVAEAEAKNIVSTAGLNSAHLWDRHGRYISFPGGQGVSAWLGTEFRLWRGIGSTPLWLVFPPTVFGRAGDVRTVLEPWAERNRIAWSMEQDSFSLGIDVPTGEGRDRVVSSVVERLRNMSEQLWRLPLVSEDKTV
jgi:hypothetical protein